MSSKQLLLRSRVSNNAVRQNNCARGEARRLDPPASTMWRTSAPIASSQSAII